MPPVFPGMVPPPHIPIPGYAYPPFPGPFRNAENQVGKSGSESTMQAFVPPVQSIDAGRNVQPPSPHGDTDASVASFPSMRPMQEPGGHLNYWWHQQTFNPRGVPVQHGTGPRMLIRPQFFGPAPGFMVGPGLPGNVLSPLSIIILKCAEYLLLSLV